MKLVYRKIRVKWKNTYSQPRTVTGRSPQGITSGILEYISQTCGNMNFEDIPQNTPKMGPTLEYTPLDPKNVFKFIDDVSLIEVINLISAGLTSYNYKVSVPSDIAQNGNFLPPQNVQTNMHLTNISEWTKKQFMQINGQKTKYMIFNKCDSKQFQTRFVY